jgi:hypothetical protein
LFIASEYSLYEARARLTSAKSSIAEIIASAARCRGAVQRIGIADALSTFVKLAACARCVALSAEHQRRWNEFLACTAALDASSPLDAERWLATAQIASDRRDASLREISEHEKSHRGCFRFAA